MRSKYLLSFLIVHQSIRPKQEGIKFREKEQLVMKHKVKSIKPKINKHKNAGITRIMSGCIYVNIKV